MSWSQVVSLPEPINFVGKQGYVPHLYIIKPASNSTASVSAKGPCPAVPSMAATEENNLYDSAPGSNMGIKAFCKKSYPKD